LGLFGIGSLGAWNILYDLHPRSKIVDFEEKEIKIFYWR
jgi:hypothetical protein